MAKRILSISCVILIMALHAIAQAVPVESETASILDSLPLGSSNPVRIADKAELQKVAGGSKSIDFINFEAGEDAAAADYEAGKLVVIEFLTTEHMADADARIRQRLASGEQSEPLHYRREGNYAVFVFGAKDEASATALSERVRYEKVVRWLGQDPFLEKRYQRENNVYITATRDMFIGSFVAVVAGITLTTILGLLFGYLYFRKRDRKHAEMEAYSDAGGMTRLNLDGMTENS